MKIKLLVLLLIGLGSCYGVVAQTGPGADKNIVWEEVSSLELLRTQKNDVVLPAAFRLFKASLLNSGRSFQQLRNTSEQTINASIPMPDGKLVEFELAYSPVMHPELAGRYPQINSFKGSSPTDRGIQINLAVSPLGIHALINGYGETPIMVIPLSKEDNEHHIVYFLNDVNYENLEVECLSEDFVHEREMSDSEKAGDCQLRTYRLAIATTAEYTASFINNPTDPTGAIGALASINAVVTQINGIYVPELAVQFQLVANNNQLIFTDASLYTNGNVGEMNEDYENKDNIDDVIGVNAYDIAHAFGTRANPGANGASKHIGNACIDDDKANGATVFNPVNPSTYLMLVCHELGHQMGANHTFNDAANGSCGNAGQLNASTAYEPGSGNTIMSYGGTCGASNVQGFRDPYFHTISLQEIAQYVVVGSGSTCPTTTPLANNQPTVNTGPVASFEIPISTPFFLTANGNDADGDPLTFAWEQFDNGLILHPPSNTVTSGPVFRGFLPGNSPTRFFPNMNAILTGTTPTWERLPAVSRSMDFVVTVRDNQAGGGCTDEDQISVNTNASAGPFTVSGIGPDDDCLFAEDQTNIFWNVANTDAAPVNCANVDIWLSLDGGNNFNVPLAMNVPNDGLQQVFIPADAITMNGRISVVCSDNIFFNVNNQDIWIDCPVDMIVNDFIATGTYQARGSVTTSGPVNVFGSAEFLAGEEVVMTDEFTAHAGCDFLAAIQPCDHCAGSKPEQVVAVSQQENPDIYFAQSNEQSELRLEGNSRNDELAISAYPNPFNEELNLVIELTNAANVYIDLFDLNGRRIRSIAANEWFAAGKSAIRISTQTLHPGVYECRIQTEKGIITTPVVKVR